MATAKKPRYDLAKKVLPDGLLKTIEHIFSQNIFDCVLVGGTALAGFYFGHRKSDDIDLFVKDECAFKAAIYAVKSLLSKKNIEILSERSSSQYFHCLTRFKDHTFTIDIVIDSNIFDVAKSETVEKNITVLTLDGLLKTKIATLVSRCSEKDLYDLLWLMEEYPKMDIQTLISCGMEIDGGMNAESLLISISGANLQKESCGFAKICNIDESRIYKRITVFQNELCKKISKFLHADKSQNPVQILLKDIRNKI